MPTIKRFLIRFAFAFLTLLLLFAGYGASQYALENWLTPLQSGTEELAYHVSGSGHSTVVALHGLAGSGGYFKGRVGSLFSQSQVISLDLLGFGSSPKPRSRYASEDHLVAIRHAIKTLGAKLPVTIVAHSMGTLIAVDWAFQFPGEVASLILLSTPLYDSPDDARSRLKNDSRMIRDLVTRSRLSEFSCYFRALYRIPGLAAWYGVPKDVFVDGTRHTWNSLSGSMEGVVLRPGYAAKLRDLKVPVIFIHGDADISAPIENVRKTAAAMPRAQVIPIPGAGHHPLIYSHDSIQRLACARRPTPCDLSESTK